MRYSKSTYATLHQLVQSTQTFYTIQGHPFYKMVFKCLFAKNERERERERKRERGHIRKDK